MQKPLIIAGRLGPMLRHLGPLVFSYDDGENGRDRCQFEFHESDSDGYNG